MVKSDEEKARGFKGSPGFGPIEEEADGSIPMRINDI
jgi:hypothetical protein